MADEEKSIIDQISDNVDHQLKGPLGKVEKEIEQVREGLTASLATLQDHLNHSLRGAIKNSISSTTSALAAETTRLTQRQHDEVLARLTASAQKILAADSQAGILAALVDACEIFSSRVVLFVSKGEHLLAWEMRNLQNQDTASGIRSARIPKSSETILAAACRENRVLEGNVSSHRENPQLLERIGTERPDSILCLPVVIRGRTAAVLYTDSIASRPRPLNKGILGLLVALCQTRIELQVLGSKLGLRPPGRPAQAATPDEKPSVEETSPPEEEHPPRAAAMERSPSQPVPEPAIEPVPVPIESEPPPEGQTPAAETSLPDETSSIPVDMTPTPPMEARTSPVQAIATDTEPEEAATPQIDVEDVPLLGSSQTPETEPAPEAEVSMPEETLPVEAEAASSSVEDETIEIDLDTIFSEPEKKEETELELSATGDIPVEVEEETPVAETSLGEVAAPPKETAPPEPADSPSMIETAQPSPQDLGPSSKPAPAPVDDAAPGGVAEAPTPDSDRRHSEAKRFARLLVSEIKLYNEQVVIEGRKHRDIYDRLKKDIDRSRDMYEKRIPQVVSMHADYFHDELVRILGANDPTTLGSDYPGSRSTAEN